ncbi:adenine-specific DNA-methyltransferase [Balneicella halophila]|uniref:Adenine-specific DNA-methyltransferase n=1 Tax=Balneicella halophila TaxID=1537566 RepID=A0A7L4UMY7_BALHA|nr:DNA methyltransferase [Balneicella halophila]PVX48803.1 adenine-specific DNA-methyltransferase [Balneicella halophila]
MIYATHHLLYAIGCYFFVPNKIKSIDFNYLHKLLSDDGVLVTHIDENEYHNLIIIYEEIFGKKNNLGTIIWDKKNPKGDAQKISYQHESIIVFSKSADLLKGKIKRKKKNAQKIIEFSRKVFAKIGKESYPEDILQICKKYKLDKSLFEEYKFNYNLETVNTEFGEWLKSQDFSGGEKAYKFIDKDGEVYRGVSMAWPNKKQAPDDYFIPLIHPVTKKECPIPARGWRNPPSTMKELLDKKMILFGEDETKQPERKYLLKENMLENISSLIGFAGSDDEFQKQIGINLENPKPHLLATEIVDWFSDEESIILDSFAGSGTTAHATLKLNSQDEGKRRFILIQCDEYDKKGNVVNVCEDVTTKRVRKVISGYGKGKNHVEGLGGSFDYFEIGLPLFDDNQNLNEQVGINKIREYIWFSETRTPFKEPKEANYFLGKKEDSVYYFIYEKDQLTTLDFDSLQLIKTKGEQYVIYADNCLLPKEFMAKNNIIFKKIPRDITRF